MFKCTECGEVFTEDEIKTWSESRGECWGQPAYEEMEGCPACKGSFEEAEECPICGRYFLSEELNEGICDSCVKDSIDDMNYAKAFEFLAQADDFDYFFLKFYFTDEVFEEPKKELSNEFRQLFKRKILADRINGNQHFLDSLKKYLKNHCFFDWAEFMSEGVNK